MTIRYVLGAPGSGKSAMLPDLRMRLPGWVVLDWDAWIEPAGRLAGRPISEHEELWQPYGELVRVGIEALASASVPVLLATVCTPTELAGWPAGKWLLLNCDDAQRAERLRERGDDAEAVKESTMDAAEYRALGLESFDTTRLGVAEVATAVARWARGAVANGWIGFVASE